MREQGATPSTTLLLAVFKACASSRDLEKAISIHKQVLDSGIQLNIFRGEFTPRHVLQVREHGACVQSFLFHAAPHRSVLELDHPRLGYFQNSQSDQALELFSRMQDEGLVPGPRTFVAALKASLALIEEATLVHVKLASLEKGVLIHSQLASQGHESNLFVASTLVDMYGKFGSLKETREVFDRMSTHDLVVWNLIITAFAQMGMVFPHLMQEEGFQPDAYVVVVGACSTHAGKEESFLKQPWLEKGQETSGAAGSSSIST